MHLWSRRLNFFKMSIPPEVIYTFSAKSIKISMSFFEKNRKTILKLIWNCKGPRAVRKKNKA